MHTNISFIGRTSRIWLSIFGSITLRKWHILI